MIPFISLAVTFLVAVYSLFLAFKYFVRPINAHLREAAGTIGIGGFIYLYGTWVFASIYCREVFGVVFLLIVVSGFFRKASPSKGDVKPRRRVGFIVAGVIFLILDVLYYTGTVFPDKTINLAVPFRKGKYFVFQGGNGLPTNVFHFFGRRTLYAMDIIKLNHFGGRGNSVFSTKLTDYEIFGDTILSPCAGVIVKAESSNPDNIPPEIKHGPKNLNGVVIGTGDAFIFLGHLKYNSVFVKEGDRVVTGQPLGLAGNSGMSLEPHLHIQAHQNTGNGKPWYQQPQMQLLFGGRGCRLFDVLNPLPAVGAGLD